jgi:hypothetical protein
MVNSTCIYILDNYSLQENHRQALRNIVTQIDDEQKGLEKTIKQLDKKKKQREKRRK